MDADSILVLEDVVAGYGAMMILNGTSLTVRRDARVIEAYLGR